MRYLFFILLLLVPIDKFEFGASLLREFGGRPVNFVILALFVYVILNEKAEFSASAYSSLVLIALGYSFSSIIVLTDAPMVMTFRSPIESWFVQSLVLFTSFAFYLTIYILLCKYRPDISMIFELAPVVFAIHLVFYSIDGLVAVDALPASFFDYSIGLFRTNRIERPSGLMSEPSYWGAFCAFIWPGLVYCFLNAKRSKRGVLLVLIVAALVTPFLVNAKTFTGILIIQFLLLMFWVGQLRWIAVTSVLLLSVASYTILFTGFMDVENNLSSAMRIGSTLLAGNVAVEHFPFGVGTGQLSFFYLDKYAPQFLHYSAEANEYFSGAAESRASAYNLFVRFFAELGVLGLAGVLLLYAIPVYKMFATKPRTMNDGLFLITYIGATAFQLSQDSFLYSPTIMFLPMAYYYYGARESESGAEKLVSL